MILIHLVNSDHLESFYIITFLFQALDFAIRCCPVYAH